MKLRRKDGELVAEITWGYAGPFVAVDGVFDLPDALGQEIVTNSGMYDIVIEEVKPASGKHKAATAKGAEDGL